MSSYAVSVRRVVINNRIEVASLERLKELVLLQRQRENILTDSDMQVLPGSKAQKRWETRVRSALRQLRKSGECALIEREKYRFFI